MIRSLIKYELSYDNKLQDNDSHLALANYSSNLILIFTVYKTKLYCETNFSLLMNISLRFTANNSNIAKQSFT